MILTSTITCPACGHQATETMPTNACQFFYDCAGCGRRLKPKDGDCCVLLVWVGAVSTDSGEGHGLLLAAWSKPTCADRAAPAAGRCPSTAGCSERCLQA